MSAGSGQSGVTALQSIPLSAPFVATWLNGELDRCSSSVTANLRLSSRSIHIFVYDSHLEYM